FRSPVLYKQSTIAVQTLDNRPRVLAPFSTGPRQTLDRRRRSMKRLNALAAILTIVGGLNWGLVGGFKVDLFAAIFGGMHFGEVNLASRVVYTLVGLSAAYLATQVPALVRASQPTPASSVTA